MPLDTDFIRDGHACPAEELVAITPKQHQQKPAIFTSASVERKKHLISDCKFPKKRQNYTRERPQYRVSHCLPITTRK